MEVQAAKEAVNQITKVMFQFYRVEAEFKKIKMKSTMTK